MHSGSLSQKLISSCQENFIKINRQLFDVGVTLLIHEPTNKNDLLDGKNNSDNKRNIHPCDSHSTVSVVVGAGQ